MDNLSDEERIDAFCRELASILRRLLGLSPPTHPDARPLKSRVVAQSARRPNRPDAARKSRASK